MVEPTVPQDNDNNQQVEKAATACVNLQVEEAANPSQINAANRFHPPSLSAFIDGPSGSSGNAGSTSVASAKGRGG